MDIIKKGNVEYSVKNTQIFWVLSKVEDKLTVKYQVSKDVCGTFEQLKQYVEKENIF